MSGDWLTMSDVAEALSVPPREVGALISAGELKAERCPSALCTWHIREESLEEYIASRLPVAS